MCVTPCPTGWYRDDNDKKCYQFCSNNSQARNVVILVLHVLIIPAPDECLIFTLYLSRCVVSPTAAAFHAVRVIFNGASEPAVIALNCECDLFLNGMRVYQRVHARIV